MKSRAQKRREVWDGINAPRTSPRETAAHRCRFLTAFHFKWSLEQIRKAFEETFEGTCYFGNRERKDPRDIECFEHYWSEFRRKLGETK